MMPEGEMARHRLSLASERYAMRNRLTDDTSPFSLPTLTSYPDARCFQLYLSTSPGEMVVIVRLNSPEDVSIATRGLRRSKSWPLTARQRNARGENKGGRTEETEPSLPFLREMPKKKFDEK